MIRLGLLLIALIIPALVPELAAQRPLGGAWGNGAHRSFADWQAAVVSWFEGEFLADTRLVLVPDEAASNALRHARGVRESSAVAIQVAAQAEPCKLAIRQPCVSAREALLRLDALKPAGLAAGGPRWQTGFWVVWMENHERMARPYAVLLEGEPDGPIRVVSAMTRSH